MSGPETRQRLVSLDVLRGLTVIGMILVNASAGLHYGDGFDVYPLLLHARWDGLTLADLVFPAFLMIVGVSIPMARGDVGTGGQTRSPFPPIGWRTLRLFALGLFLSNLYWLQSPDDGHWRFWGVLQRIGLVYGACAVLFLTTSSRVRIGIAIAILALYWPLSLLPSLDAGPTDLGQAGANFVASLDRVTLGDHAYVKGPLGYDPEGLLGTLPAIAQGLIGVWVGELVLRRGGAGTTSRLAIAGASMLAIGLVWGLFFPVIKDIWSSSFVLTTCGLTILALTGLHAMLDRPKPPGRGPGFFIALPLAFGVNAIAAYVLHALAAPMVGSRPLLAIFEWARPLIGGKAAALIPIVLFIAFIGACMEYLRRRRWIIRI